MKKLLLSTIVLLCAMTLTSCMSFMPFVQGTKKTCVATKYLEVLLYKDENGVYQKGEVTTKDPDGNPGWYVIPNTEQAQMNIIVYDKHVTINAAWHHEYYIISPIPFYSKMNVNDKELRFSAIDEEGLKCWLMSGTFKTGATDNYGDSNYEFIKVQYNNRMWLWQITVVAEEYTTDYN